MRVEFKENQVRTVAEIDNGSNDGGTKSNDVSSRLLIADSTDRRTDWEQV